MTIDEFLAELKKTRKHWRVTPEGWLKEGSHCPITHVAHRRHASIKDSCDFEEASDLLGLTMEESEKIMAAADDEVWADQSLRRRLLEAVGVSE